MNGADLIAAVLKREGVEVLPCFPHSDLIEACAKVGIRPIIVRQERQALHIADGFARTTGGQRLCATTVQYGPGSENAFGAVAQCYADNVPVLHIPGGYLTGDRGVPPNFDAGRNMQLVTKWCETVLQTDRLPQMLQSAFSLMRNGRPGPVVLEVPIDRFTEEVDEGLLDRYRPVARSRPVAAASEVSALIDAVSQAKTPVIVAGQGVLYGQATDELVRFAEATNTPVLSTLNGKSAFPENHPLSLGCGGGSRPDVVNTFLDRADLILGLGTGFTHSDYITPYPVKGKTFAQVTISETDLAKDYPVDIGVIGDVKATLEAMLTEWWSRGGSAGSEDIAGLIAQHKEAFLDQWTPLLTSDETPINPYRVIHDVMNTVDRSKTVVTHDAGSPRDQVTAFYEAIVPHGYMGWGKTTQLGMGLGLVQGAKLARPDWTCINFMGEAAIGMVGMDFETSVRCNIGTTTIVLKNSVMGGYADYHPVASEKYGINALGGDYAGVATALGGYGETVEDPAQIILALKRALDQNAKGVPALLQMITSEEGRIPRNLCAGLS